MLLAVSEWNRGKWSLANISQTQPFQVANRQERSSPQEGCPRDKSPRHWPIEKDHITGEEGEVFHNHIPNRG